MMMLSSLKLRIFRCRPWLIIRTDECHPRRRWSNRCVYGVVVQTEVWQEVSRRGVSEPHGTACSTVGPSKGKVIVPLCSLRIAYEPDSDIPVSWCAVTDPESRHSSQRTRGGSWPNPKGLSRRCPHGTWCGGWDAYWTARPANRNEPVVATADTQGARLASPGPLPHAG